MTWRLNRLRIEPVEITPARRALYRRAGGRPVIAGAPRSFVKPPTISALTSKSRLAAKRTLRIKRGSKRFDAPELQRVPRRELLKGPTSKILKGLRSVAVREMGVITIRFGPFVWKLRPTKGWQRDHA